MSENGMPRFPQPSQDPVLRKAWQDAMVSSIEQTNQLFKDIRSWFVKPFQTAYYMNVVMFIVGIFFFVASIGISIYKGVSFFALAFGGLGVQRL